MSLRAPLLPKPATSGSASPGSRSLETAAAFLCFVAVRSVHPIVIDASKTDGRLPYGKATPCVINSAVDVIIGNGLAFLLGGAEGLKSVWDPKPLKVFSAIAIAYALGDFLEMQSMSVMGGAAYQILLQSKLLVTALIVWTLRGQRQTPLQWNVLVTIALAMSAFVLVDEEDSQAPFQPVGLLYVITKVVFSCACAVLTEKYLKVFANSPIYVQIAQLKFAWFWVSLALTMYFDHDVVQRGFFAGWDGRTLVVATSWVCKGWTTFLVLKGLDSVLKNIGEAVAILVIYLFDLFIADAVSSFLPVHGKPFQLASLLMVMVVVLTVITYTMVPTWKRPSK